MAANPKKITNETQENPESLENDFFQDEVHQGVARLLLIFERQLLITAERSAKDYTSIMNFCLRQIEKDDVSIDEKHTILTALQYRDRYIQRNDHVINRLKELIQHILRQDLSAITDELEKEIYLARSWYQEQELVEFTDLANGYCDLESLEDVIKSCDQFDDDDMEFFN